MSSSKARSLRERMSIDPDEPEPVSRARRPRAESHPAEETPAAETPAAETPAAEMSAEATPAEETPAEGAAAAEMPVEGAAAAEMPVEGTAAAEKPAADAPAAGVPAPRASPPRAASERGGRRRQRDDPAWVTALDDPAVSTGGNGYRSFYVSDEVFARFRAAVYWTARRPDALDVPANMSVGVEDYMDRLATDLERRFNDRVPFPPTPEQIRSHRRRENGGR